MDDFSTCCCALGACANVLRPDSGHATGTHLYDVYQAGQERCQCRVPAQHSPLQTVCAGCILHGDTDTAAACSGLQTPDTPEAIIAVAKVTPQVLSTLDCGSYHLWRHERQPGQHPDCLCPCPQTALCRAPLCRGLFPGHLQAQARRLLHDRAPQRLLGC